MRLPPVTSCEKTLGEHTFDSLLENKRIEWSAYRAHVSDFEMQRYLPVL